MDYDVIIVGAGAIGASAAIALQKQGLHVAMVDAKAAVKPCDEPDLRVLALSYQNLLWLKSIGVLDRLNPQRLCTYDSMYIDDAQGRSSFTFEAYSISRPYLGMIVDSQHLLSTLHGVLEQNPHCFYEEKVLSLSTREGIQVITTDKRELKAKVILAADGAQSLIKEQLGITGYEHDYQQRAVVAYLQSEDAKHWHEHRARQRFLSTGSLALLPCPEPYRVSMVWTLPKEEALTVSKLSPEGLSARLYESLGEKLTVVSPVASFALKARHAHQYGAQGIFLVGDAAHTIHPLAGLGANLGFSDVKAIAQLLTQTPKAYWQDPRVLAQYQRERRYVNLSVSQLMSCLNQLMVREGLWGELRGWGMRAFDRLTPLKALSILYTDKI